MASPAGIKIYGPVELIAGALGIGSTVFSWGALHAWSLRILTATAVFFFVAVVGRVDALRSKSELKPCRLVDPMLAIGLIGPVVAIAVMLSGYHAVRPVSVINDR